MNNHQKKCARKTCFKTLGHAADACAKVNAWQLKKRAHNRSVLRVYKCDWCEGFHLTSAA